MGYIIHVQIHQKYPSTTMKYPRIQVLDIDKYPLACATQGLNEDEVLRMASCH